MINVSNAFRKELYNDNRNYLLYADITLADGTELNLDNSDFWQGGFSIEDSISASDAFTVGGAVINKLTLVINNIYEEFSEYDFSEAEVEAKVGLKLPNGTTESFRKGLFIVDETKYNGSLITLTCLDNMSKFDTPYSESTLAYPATLAEIVRDACIKCEVTLQSYTFPHSDYTVQTRPDDEATTFREIISWCAQIACCYARCDTLGRLVLDWYNTSVFESEDKLDGGRFDSSNPYASGDTADGGTFNPWSNGDDYDGDDFDNLKNFHHIYSNYSVDIATDDVVITGVKVVVPVESEESSNEYATYQTGTDGYVISVEGNDLIQGEDGATIAGWIGTALIGLRFRSGSVSHSSDPTIEAGDIAYLTTRQQNSYPFLVSYTKFSNGSTQSTECIAETPARNSATRFSASTKNYVEFRKNLKQQKTQFEDALDELDQRIENSSGLFTTEEEQPDGSIIFYMHDKPTLSESQIVWQMTAEAWGVSTDGGKTFNAGMTVDGDTIVRILTAVGINADWIKTGAFVVEKDGQIMFRADTDTGQVDIVANSFSLQGQSVSDIAEQQVNDFVDTVYTPAIDNLQAQIDGQIETWFYDYIPTTSNYPASNWTTDTERDKHLGDLFYVVDNAEYGGQAYRWAKINNAYTWDYVEDTAVTKALADAAAAQDTADQKRRVFVSQPVPPYDVGDLWVGNSSSDLMRCQTSRQSGNYNAADWIKAVKYTDDSELQAFIQGDYADTIEEIKTQADQKAETWYQSTDPSINWSEDEKSEHKGDLWYNTSEEKTYIYNGTSWQETRSNPPDEVFDTINGKAQIFIAQPVTPYDVGDVWFTGTSIMVCNTARTSGNFNSADWQKKDNYTDDSALYEFIEGDYQSTIENLQEQADQKAETWYQATDPSASWSTADKAKHKGDLWYNTTEQKTYIYNGSAWEETKSNPPDEVFDTIDGKAQIYVNTPVPPYDVGDLWAQGSGGDIMRCKTARQSGAYVSADWELASKYTDDTAVDDLDNALDQEGVFNRLTNNGTLQGIYMQNGRLYINATYIVTGKITSKNGLVFFDLDNNEIHCDKLVSTQPYSLVANTVVDITRRNIGGSNYVYGVQVYNENYETKRVTISPGNNDDHPVISTGTTADPTGISIRSRVSNGNYTGNAYLEFLDNGWVELSAPTGGSVDPLIRLFPGHYTDSDGTTSDLAGSVTISGTTIDLYATDVNVSNRLNVRGSKSRLVKTKDYGERVFYCYETSSPMFGDIGEATIDENGECVITIDDIFAETVASHIEYHVFLQKEGAGDLWVEEKNERYFIVKGTKNLKFSWEIKAKQRDYEYERLDEYGVIYPIDEATPELFYESEIENIIAEQEVALYEAIK